MDGPPHIARQNVGLEKSLLQNLIPSAVMLGDLIVFGSLEPGACSVNRNSSLILPLGSHPNRGG